METTRKITHKTIQNGEVLMDSTSTEVISIEEGDDIYRAITISKNEFGENESVSFEGVHRFSDNSYRDESFYINNEFLFGNASDITDIDQGKYHITTEDHYYCIIEGNHLNDVPETLPEDSLILDRTMVTTRSKNPSGIEYAVTSVTECKTDEGDEYNYTISTYTLPVDTEMDPKSPFNCKTQLIAVNSLEPGRTGVRLICLTAPDDGSRPEILFSFENVGSKDSEPSAFISTHGNYNQMDSILNVSITDFKDGNVYFELKNETTEIQASLSVEEYKSGIIKEPNSTIYVENTFDDYNKNTREIIGGTKNVENIISLIPWNETIEKINDVLEYIKNTDIANIGFMFDDGVAHYAPDYIEA